MKMKETDLTKFCNTELKSLPIAMSYTPMQRIKSLYDDEMALKSGTLYPELDKPFNRTFPKK